MANSFSTALIGLKSGEHWRRAAHRSNKHLRVKAADGCSLSYIELVYDDGRRAPWTPTRCDLLECDWIEVTKR